MPAAVQVAGVAGIWVAIPRSGSLEFLGYTINGADISDEAHLLDVPGDENGGDSGPPIDVQFMGRTVRIRLELTKFDVAVADKLAARVAGLPPIAIAQPGTLLFAEYSVRLLVWPVVGPINFPLCLCREPIQVNKGTKYSRLLLDFTAYRGVDDGQQNVIMNQDIN